MSTNALGAIILSDGAPQMGIHTILTGETLEEIRALGVSDRDLALNAQEYAGRASRVDVALDIWEGTLKPNDLVREYVEGHCTTPARSAMSITDLIGSEDTMYVGKGGSNRLFRAYDKGAQVQSETAWIRLELECRKLVARNVLDTLADIPDTRAVVNAAIRTFVDFPRLPEYQTVLSGSNVLLPRVPRRMTNTYRWLMDVCAPALARYELEHPDDDVLHAFLAARAVALERFWQNPR
jgi:hypothetical protein